MAEKSVPYDKQFIFVCDLEEIQRKVKIQRSVSGRELAVFYHKGNVYAMDYRCYHAGGPLSEGDIEEVHGRSCIVCPYHKYKITLDNGEGLYYAFNPKDFRKPPKLCSKGIKQRTHHVKITDNQVYIALSDTRESRDSDYYSSSTYKAAMSLS